MFISNSCKYILTVILFTFSISTFAQWGTTRASWNGNYDIKMVGSIALQPAIVTSTANNPYAIDKIVTQDMLDQNGAVINNDWCSGAAANPISSVSFPIKAYNGISVTDLDLANYGKDVCAQSATSTASNYPTVSKSVALVYSDCDDNMTTFQSSAAFVDYGTNMECTTIEAAYLYWAGNLDAYDTKYTLPYPGLPTMKSYDPGGAISSNIGGAQVPLSSSYKTVLFKHQDDPGYTSITGNLITIAATITDRYVCVADVTTQVKGKKGGLFWVANLRSSSSKNSGGAAAGWVLVIISKPPNCPPRKITLWDGMAEAKVATASEKIDITLSLAGMTPATSNFKSYLGIAALDGENTWDQIGDKTSYGSMTITGMKQNVTVNTPAECLDITPNNGSTIHVNPFYTDQQGYKYTSVGVPITSATGTKATYGEMCSGVIPWYLAQDGISSSRITTYLDGNGLNGNETTRLPYNRNTLGLDVHHMRMPDGCLLPGTTSVKMTYLSGKQGGTMPFLSYIAVETLQPNLSMKKTSDVSQVATSGIITYTLNVRNVGGQASLTGVDNYIVDSLDLGIDYNTISTAQWLEKNGTAHNFTLNTNMWRTQNNSGALNEVEYLKFSLPAAIAACGTDGKPTDSIRIVFQAKVLPLSRADVWSKGCKNVIQNKANIYYKSLAGDSFSSGSNSENGCGGAENTAVQVVDPALTALLNSLFTVEADLTAKNPTSLLVKSQVTDSLKNAICRANGWAIGSHTTEINTILPEYKIYDEYYNLLTGTENFTIDKIYQTCYAIRVIEGGDYDCTETYTFVFKVAQIPTLTLVKVNDPLCAGTATAKVRAELRGGGSGFGVRLKDKVTDKVVWSSRSKFGVVDVDYMMENLPAGTYTAVLDVLGEVITAQSKDITLTDPSPLTMSIVPSAAITVANDSVGKICRSTPFSLSQNIGSQTGLNFVWKSSPDSITWTTESSTTSSLSVTGVTDTMFYKAYACNSICSIEKKYKVLPFQLLTFPTMKDSICSGKGKVITPYDSIVSPSLVPTTLTYSWAAPVVAGVTGTLAGTNVANINIASLVNNNLTPTTVNYVITPKINGCDGAPFTLSVVVKGHPSIAKVSPPAALCVGGSLNPTAPTVTLNNTVLAATNPKSWQLETGVATGVYNDVVFPVVVTAADNGKQIRYRVTTACSTYYSNDTAITVNPIPHLNSSLITPAICSASSFAYTATSATAGATFAWTRPTITGISELTASGSSNSIAETLTNTSATPITVPYYFVTTANTCFGYDTVKVKVYQKQVAGKVGSSQTICYGATPSALTNVTLPSGGKGAYTYQWQSSIDNISFSNVSGANLTAYSPGALTATTYYRRMESDSCGTVYSDTVKITVYAKLTAGKIGSAQIICYNTTPSALTETVAAVGGIGTYSYQWQSSTDNVSFSNISAATSNTYSPSALTSSTYYRREVTSGSCGTVYSDTVKITVNPNFTAGKIGNAQAICSGKTPAALNETVSASGGTGAYSYQWQSSTDNVSFSDISGEVLAGYSPSALTASTYYRRLVTSGTCGTVPTDTVAITVNALPTISGTSTPVCVGLKHKLVGSVASALTNPWISASPAIASIDNNGELEGLAAGTSEITFTDINGCSTKAVDTVKVCTSLNLSSTPVAPVCKDDEFDLKISLSNVSTASATSVSVKDAVPAEFTYVSSTASDGSYNNSTGVWTVGNLASSTTATLTVRVKGTTAGVAIAYKAYVASVNSTSYSDYNSTPASLRTQIDVDVNALPAVLALSSTAKCANLPTEIKSTTSETGVNYQLYDNTNTPVGASLAGTGSALSWTSMPAASGYYVKGTNATSSCKSTSLTVSVSQNPMPAAFNLSAPAVCDGETPKITSSSSETGVEYQLYNRLNAAVGIAQAGTGAILTWTNMPADSGYYVIAKNTVTTCATASTDTVKMVINPTPAINNMKTSVCDGFPFGVSPVDVTNGVVPIGTSYSWSAPSVPSITGTASGASATDISGTLFNATTDSIDVIYTVTPKVGTCTGASFTVTATIKGTPQITKIVKKCAADLLTYSDTITVSGGALTSNVGTVSNPSTNVWVVSSITAGVDADLTLKNAGCQFTTTVAAPNCNCPTILAPTVTGLGTGDKSYCDGSTIPAISVDAPAAGFTIDWYATLHDVTPIPAGKGTTSYTPTATGTLTYYAEVRDTTSNCTGPRIAVKLTQLPRPTAVITGDTAICPSASTPLKVTFTGKAPWNFTWTDGTTPTSVASTSVNPFTFNVSPTANKAYTLTALSDANCTSISADITGQADVSLKSAPSITTQPSTVKTCEGTSASFAVAASGDGLKYQWYKGITAISGATLNTYTIPAVAFADSGSYTVRVSGDCGTPVVSNVAKLIVDTIPVITLQPVGATHCPKDTVSFSVKAKGTGLSYQWYKGATAISGAIDSTYTINTLQAADAGTYSVTVSGTCAPAAPSSPAVLTMNAAPKITQQPQNLTLCPGAGTTATFSVVATGTGLTYQWRKDSVNIPGATASTYSISPVSLADSASYDVIVSGVCAPADTSLVAKLSLNKPTQITLQPTSVTVCQGDSSSLVIKATGTALTYQWKRNGTPIVGATNDTLTILSAAKSDSAQYSVDVIGSCNTLSSQSALLTVFSLPTVKLVGADTICSGNQVSLNVYFTGKPNWTYAYNDGTNNVTKVVAGEDVINKLNVTAQTIFTATSLVDGNGCHASASGLSSKTVIPIAAPKINFEASLSKGLPYQELCVGSTISEVVYSVNTETNSVILNKVLPSNITLSSIQNGLVKFNGLMADSQFVVVITPIGKCPGLPTSLTLEPIELPKVSLSAPLNICKGDSLKVIASILNPTANSDVNYVWKSMGKVDTTASNQYTVAASASNLLRVVGVASRLIHGGMFEKTCYSLPDTTITNIRAIPSNPVTSNYLACQTSGILKLSSLVEISPSSSLIWYSDKSRKNVINPGQINKMTVLDSTFYVASGAVYSNASGGQMACTSLLDTVKVQIYENPVITRIIKSDLSNIQVEVINGKTPYTYEVNGMSSSFVGIADLGMQTFGNHTIVVTEASSKKCKAQVSFTIDPLPLVPEKYFTPNDDGINDTWDVENIEYYPNSEVYIHDRYGKELLKANGSSFKGWDGKYLGSDLPGADYWYIIYVRETGKRMLGHFLLKR